MKISSRSSSFLIDRTHRPIRSADITNGNKDDLRFMVNVTLNPFPPVEIQRQNLLRQARTRLSYSSLFYFDEENKVTSVSPENGQVLRRVVLALLPSLWRHD